MANDFSGDTDVIALYNFESGVLTSDSKNSNTLTDVNTAGTDTTNFKEGSASTVLDRTADEYFSIADVDMQSDFPLKAGTANTVFSLVGWFRFTEGGSRKGIVVKYETDSRRSFTLTVEPNRSLRITQGYNDGDLFEVLYLGSDSDTVINQWYHYKVTYNSGAWTIRVWDDTGSTIIIATGGTASETISLETVPWSIGSYRPDAGGSGFDGNLDETIFFKRIVSDADQDLIIAGTYGAGGTTHQLAGSLNSASQVAGSLRLTQRLSGSLNSASSVSGVLRLVHRMSASLNSSTIVSGKLRLTQRLRGTINSRSIIRGNLRIAGELVRKYWRRRGRRFSNSGRRR